MTKTDIKKALKEITKDRLTEKEQNTLGDMIRKARETGESIDFNEANAVIQFLYKAGRIELTMAMDISDLLG